MTSNLTLVTALFDIGRGDIDAGFSRKYSQYLECFTKLLELDLPLVVFCDETTEQFVMSRRKSANTRIIRKTVDDLRNFPFYDNIQKIRTSPDWVNRSGWIAGSPQAALSNYNPLVMSKQFMLNDASIFNFFDTKYFAWIDAGLSNTVALNNYLTSEDTLKKLTRKMNKMLYIAFPYDGTVEVHGFEKTALDRYAGEKTEYVVRGGFFGGTREAIAEINDLYYNMLGDTLAAGLMGTEESVFTILSYRNKDKINLNMIESNGLVYKFFEDVQNSSPAIPNGDGSLAVYVLTYNLPAQFALWINSFKKAFPVYFDKCPKYVINNSTDRTTDEEYAKLISENGFTEFKYDNIGINDGRHEVAKHFANSSHEFMIFFEDDMLLHTNEQKSKLGFCTYYNNAFDIAIDIINNENLDYLKLSFDEFYGNNLENWGWYNVPESKRKILFPDGDKRTKIHHLGSHKGMPYAVGEFHYCNWPILFTKHGNQKIFLDEEYAHKYEQTWMSMVCSMQRDGKILAGSLLGSIINHNRVHHYKSGTRKENKHN